MEVTIFTKPRKMSQKYTNPIPGPLLLRSKTPSEQLQIAIQMNLQVHHNNLHRSVLCGHRFKYNYYENAIQLSFINMYQLYLTDSFVFMEEAHIFIKLIKKHKLETYLFRYKPLCQVFLSFLK
jgi:hypothetical protein